MPIIANKSENQRKKLAKSHDLSEITFSILQTAHILTMLERRWFSFFVALAKRGFDGIAVSIGELTDHEFRVNGQTHSERSSYRALAGLKKKGFISNQKLRLGPNRFRSLIYFEPSAFAWYLKKRTANVVPIPTLSHKNAPLPTWQKDSLTSNTGVLLSTCVSPLLDSKTRTKTGYKNPKIASALLPILITLRAMLPGARRVLGVERGVILARAEREMESGDYLSGIDWHYWGEPRWTEFSHERRDATALSEIIPQLISPDYGRRNKDDRLNRLVGALAGSTQDCRPPPEIPVLTREQVANSRPPPESSLDGDEFRALLEARERGRARLRAG